MSEQEAGREVQAGDEGENASTPLDQVGQEMTQEGMGSGQAAMEDAPDTEMETGKKAEQESSEPSQDTEPVPAGASQGAGSEDAPVIGDPSGSDQASPETGHGGSQESSDAAKSGEEATSSAPVVDPSGEQANATSAEASEGTGQADETLGSLEKANGKPEEDGATGKMCEDGQSPPGALASSDSAIQEADSSAERRVAIVTGANNGIGLVAAEKLARDGYEVIMACRNEEKATKALQEIKKKVPTATVSFMKLDLSSLRSVREFADAFRSRGGPLHVLCNNAGLTTGFTLSERQQTEDGFEMTIGVNHLGHFLLTHLLLDDLKRTASRCGEARIVHTSSSLHDPDTRSGKRGIPAHLDLENLMMDKPGTFNGELAYKNSKLANCSFSVELAKRLEGTNVTSNSLCPGFIPSTGLNQNETLRVRIQLALVVPLLRLLGAVRTVEHGGGLIHDIATNPKWKGVTGKHFTDFQEMLSSKESRDPEVCKRLWDISADLVQYEQAKAL